MLLPNLKSFRALPPAGGFIGFFQIFSAALCSKQCDNIAASFPNHSVYLVNSGKSALYLYFLASFQQSKTKEIALSGYTCPDVAVAAIKAGYKLRLLDVEYNSAKLNIDSNRTNGIETIVLSNLYGQVDEVGEGVDAAIIDDACQAALSFRHACPLGVSGEKIGIFSFGRGKAYSASGGGLLLVPKNMKEINQKATEIYSSWAVENFLTSTFKLIKCAAYSILEKPYLYRIVLLLPFLNLGETRVEFKFSNLQAGIGTKILFLASQQFKLEKTRMVIKLKSIYQESIPRKLFNFETAKNNEENLIRLPVVVSEKVKRIISTSPVAKKMALKLGISISYPSTIKDYFNAEYFSHSSEDIPNSSKIAKTLITLPIGTFVTKSDVNEIVEFLENIENDKIV